MPISDNYFVQALVHSTQASARGSREALQWASKESEGFRSASNGVQIDLDSVPTRSGPRLYLTLSRDDQRVYVEEPVNTGFIFEGYQSEADRDLARLLRELFCVVAEQCAERARTHDSSPVRDSLFRQALFGEKESSAA